MSNSELGGLQIGNGWLVAEGHFTEKRTDSVQA